MKDALNFNDIFNNNTQNLALASIDLLEAVNINAITPELGYYYSLKFGDADLCPKMTCMHNKYATEHYKQIQVDMCLNMVNLVQRLAEPFLLEYPSDSYKPTLSTIPLTDEIVTQIDRFCPKRINLIHDLFGELKVLMILLWDRASRRSDLSYDVRNTYYNTYPASAKELPISVITDTFIPLLNLRAYDVENPDDINSLLTYCSKQHMELVTTILKIIYRLVGASSISFDTNVAMSSAVQAFIRSVPVRIPEAVIDITSVCNFNNNHVIDVTNPINRNVVDNYLSTLFTVCR